MRKFSINANKQILDLYGNRKVLLGVTLGDYLGCSFESRTDYTHREIPGHAAMASPGPSMPTYQAPELWRSATHVESIIDRLDKMGVNCIRVGYEPATQYTDAWTDANGVTWPSDIEMLDTIIDLAGQREMLVILTGGYPFVSNANNQATLTYIANRYRTGGVKESPYVAINPKNEINCEAGNGACTTSATWVSNQATNVTTIRATGFDGLIVLNPPNWGHDLNTCQAGFIANSTLNNDGGIVIGIHSYQRLGTDTTFDATRVTYETTSWYTYRNTFCIINEESGIYNFSGRYDPDLDSTVTATGATSWAQMQAYKTAEMIWYVDACKNQNVNGLIACRWSAYDPLWASGAGAHDDNSLTRRDGSFTTWGLIWLNNFLRPMAGYSPPAAVYSTLYNPTLSYTSGNVAGYLVRVPIAANTLSDSAAVSRFTVKAPANNSMAIAEVFIAEQAVQSAGVDAWDLVTSPITRITFGGANGVNVAAGMIAQSDDITFTLDKTKTYILSISFAGTSNMAYGPAPGSYYYKSAAAASVATANVATMSTIATSWSVFSKIEKKN